MGFPSTIPDTGTWPTGKGRGLCLGCNRDLYIHGTGPITKYCSTCTHTMANTDRPLYQLANGRTEVLPQERPIEDWSWRENARCRFTDHPGFGDFALINEELPPEVVEANELYCERCPVRAACAREADAHEYMGLWAGWFRNYRVNPVMYGLHKVTEMTIEFRVPIRVRENASADGRLRTKGDNGTGTAA